MLTLANLTETLLYRAVDPWQRAGAQMNVKRYHLRQARICDKLVAGIAAREGRGLDPADARRAEEYAADVLGWRGYAPWLKVYALRAGGFREGWMPDNYYSQVVIPAINGTYRHMAQIRQMGSRLFGPEIVPDSVHVVRGRFYAPDGAPIPSEQVAAHLFSRGDGSVFKANWSGMGDSIRVVRRGEFEPGGNWADGVFQHFVEAHPTLRQFYDRATATLRLTTALDPDGTPRLRAAYIRIARSGDLYVHVATLIRVVVDLETGAFADQGMLSDWSLTPQHPDTGLAFAGARIPGFAAARDLVLACHASVPFVGCVGWDIAVAADERPWLLEWNAVQNDIKVSEALQGPCFKGLGWERLWRTAA